MSNTYVAINSNGRRECFCINTEDYEVKKCELSEVSIKTDKYVSIEVSNRTEEEVTIACEYSGEVNTNGTKHIVRVLNEVSIAIGSKCIDGLVKQMSYCSELETTDEKQIAMAVIGALITAGEQAEVHCCLDGGVIVEAIGDVEKCIMIHSGVTIEEFESNDSIRRVISILAPVIEESKFIFV